METWSQKASPAAAQRRGHTTAVSSHTFPNVFTLSLRRLLLGVCAPYITPTPRTRPPTRPTTYLKELLDDVVPEHVHHELVGGLQDLAEDQLALGGAGPLQLQLDEPEPEGKKGLMFDLMTGTGP